MSSTTMPIRSSLGMLIGTPFESVALAVPVAEDHDAVLQHLGIDEVEQRRRGVTVDELVGLGAAEKQRMHPPAQFVQEPLLQHGERELAEAVLDDVLPGA